MSALENARKNFSDNVSRLQAVTNKSVSCLAQLMGVERKLLYRARSKEAGTDVTLWSAARIAEHFGIEVADLYAPHDVGWAEKIVVANIPSSRAACDERP